MGAIHQIVFDCTEPVKLAQFWADVLDGYTVRQSDITGAALSLALGLETEIETTVMVDGPGPSLCFQNVHGQRPDNNRVHLDIAVSNRASEVERLKGLGASVDRVLPTYTVMQDPEGNQLCLIDRRDERQVEEAA